MLKRRSNYLVVTLIALAVVTTSVPSPALARPGAHFEEINPLVRRSIIDDPDPTGGVRQLGHRARTGPVAIRHHDPGSDGSPSILFHPTTHDTLVAWARPTEDGFDVVLTRLADGHWSEPVVVAGSPADELDPQLTVDPRDGSVHVVYWIRDAGATVFHRRTGADLVEWDPPREVSPPGEVAVRPSVAFHEGQLRVVYESHGNVLGSTPHLIVLASEAPGGFETRTVGVSRNSGPSRPFVDGDSQGLRIEWIDDDGVVTSRRETVPRGAGRSGTLGGMRHDLVGIDGR